MGGGALLRAKSLSVGGRFSYGPASVFCLGDT